jgi:hypothetical protein
MKKYKQREFLTNEYINKNFSDNFSLALASINGAKDLIKAGREFTLQSLFASLGKIGAVKKEIPSKIEIEEEIL